MRLHHIEIPDVEGWLYQSAMPNKLSLHQKGLLVEKYHLTGVVNLIRPKDDDLAKMVAYWHFPIPDGKVDVNRFFHLVVLVSASLTIGENVLVHCRAGRNRSGLFNALVYRNLTHCSGHEAMEVIRKYRPRAIANPEFEKILEALP